MTLLSRLFAGNATQQDMGRLQQVGAFLSSFGAAAGAAGSQGRDTLGGLAGALGAGSQGLATARQQMLQEQLVKNRLEESERKKRAAAAFQKIVQDPRFKNPDGSLKTREALKAWVAAGGDPNTFLQFKRDEERQKFRAEQNRLQREQSDLNNRRSVGSAAEGRRLRREELEERRRERKQRREELGLKNYRDKVGRTVRSLSRELGSETGGVYVPSRHGDVHDRAAKILRDKKQNPNGDMSAREAIRIARGGSASLETQRDTAIEAVRRNKNISAKEKGDRIDEINRKYRELKRGR